MDGKTLRSSSDCSIQFRNRKTGSSRKLHPKWHDKGTSEPSIRKALAVLKTLMRSFEFLLLTMAGAFFSLSLHWFSARIRLESSTPHWLFLQETHFKSNFKSCRDCKSWPPPPERAPERAPSCRKAMARAMVSSSAGCETVWLSLKALHCGTCLSSVIS